MQRLLIALTAFAIFTLYTLVVVVQLGLLGFLGPLLAGGWSTQVFLDLVVALLGFFVLAVPDAKRLGISAWPFALAFPFLGSIALLAYFVRRELAALKR